MFSNHSSKQRYGQLMEIKQEDMVKRWPKMDITLPLSFSFLLFLGKFIAFYFMQSAKKTAKEIIKRRKKMELSYQN